MEKTGAIPTAASKFASRDAFRLDINALRALSVVAVVGFHFQIPGFAGGFVGVDVFLVITGYLMTAKVLNDLKLGRFSLWTFWMMRMRRIYPALAVLTIASVIVGWFVTLPAEYLRHLLQALSALTFLSNFAFKSDSGYFAMAAQTKPLLHTWSLSLEWQFYFFMPLIVGLVWRLASRAMSGINAVVVALQVFAALSLAWCLWASQQDATGSSFFSLQARAWEPLAGGLIAAAEIRRRSEGIADPSVAAIADHRCRRLGAGRGLRRLSLARSAMARRAHDPADPGLGHDHCGATGEPRRRPAGGVCDPARGRLVLLDLSLALADLGLRPELVVRARVWRGRHAEDFDGARLAGARRDLVPLYRAALQNSAGFLDAAQARGGFRHLVRGVGGLRVAGFSEPRFSRQAAGVPVTGRTGEKDQHAARRVSSETRTPPRRRPRPIAVSAASRRPEGRSAILWGDSFVNQYLEPISSAALANGIQGLIATQSGCRSFLDDAAVNAADRQPCREFNRTTLDFVLGRSGPGIVVLGSNWDECGRDFRSGGRLLSAGKTVVLIMPLLHFGFDLPQRWIENQIRAGRAIDEWKVEAGPGLTKQRVPERDRSDPRQAQG